jgi:hypothetical protein
MSKKAARLWQQVFDQMSTMGSSTVNVNIAAAAAIDEHVQHLATLPQQPSAVLKALIQEFQVRSLHCMA